MWITALRFLQLAPQVLLHSRLDLGCGLHPRVLDNALPCVTAACVVLALASRQIRRRSRSWWWRSNFEMAQNLGNKPFRRNV